jgi:hypothetical protein
METCKIFSCEHSHEPSASPKVVKCFRPVERLLDSQEALSSIELILGLYVNYMFYFRNYVL